MNGLSLNIADDRINQLKQLFPEVFKENKVDFKQLRATLGDFVATPTEERYGISWAGKYEAFKEIQKQTFATLTPISSINKDWKDSDNIFIEGENLEVLRVLQKSYYGKVKMIYIDPPYNTGNDSFVYPDDFAERQDEYKQKAGITNENNFLNKQDLFKKNTKENGHFHSAWLSMMYPRLYLARNLLKEDGVIFVSIDDNEQANLKLLMDEIFGEENFVANLVWKKRVSPANDAQWFSSDHEYIFVYARNKGNWFPIRLKRNDKQNSYYKNPDNDPRGNWNSAAYTCNKSKIERPNLYYPIVNPFTNEEIYPKETAVWAYSKDVHLEHVKENLLYWGGDGRSKYPRKKQFLIDANRVVPRSFLEYSEVGSTQSATLDFLKIFPHNYFNYTKPLNLIKRFIDLSCESNDLILDFFAGSCTTAHAILELNQEDGGNRRFMCVQMPEILDEKSEAYRAGYRTISDIGKARIEKVIEKIRKRNEGKLDFEAGKQDVGFRSFSLQNSNFRQWQSDIRDKNEIEILKQLEVFTNPVLDKAKPENMLIELILKAGLPLTVKIDTHKAGEGDFYHLPKYKLCIALAGFGEDTRLKIRNLHPTQAIVLNNLFQNDDELMANTQLEYKENGIKLTVI